MQCVCHLQWNRHAADRTPRPHSPRSMLRTAKRGFFVAFAREGQVRKNARLQAPLSFRARNIVRAPRPGASIAQQRPSCLTLRYKTYPFCKLTAFTWIELSILRVC